MGQAYTPGLIVTPHTKIRKRRELPLAGRVLVKQGDSVAAATAVLSADLPGELEIIRVADRLGLDPIDVLPKIRVKTGNPIKKGDLLCEVKSFFGLFSNKLQSSVEGVIEFITEANAHIGVRLAAQPLLVNAYISGQITKVEPGKAVLIETAGALIQGVFGVGGERHGNVLALNLPNDIMVSADSLKNLDLNNKVVVGGAAFDLSALEFAAANAVSAVVTGSIDAATLRHFVGTEIGVAVTGDEQIPFTLIITEGFGLLPISSRIVELGKALDGKPASVNGATQVRAGATRPEIIVPQETPVTTDQIVSGGLQLGTRVRLIRVPYFGEFGTVNELASQPVKIQTGAVVRVLKVMLDCGEEVTVPRANVELL